MTIAQAVLTVFFDNYNLDTKSKLCKLFEIEDYHLQTYIRGWIFNNLQLSDLGEFFYCKEDFDESEYVGAGEFIIYDNELRIMIGTFYKDFQEICQEFGATEITFFNHVILNQVIQCHNKLALL